MYLEHYGLKLKPFEIDPDPKFLWLGKKHQEAFAALKNVILIISENALLSGYALNTKKIGPEIILDSQGPGHRLIHEICELDKEFTAQLPVHLQKHRERAILATEAQTSKKKRPLETAERALPKRPAAWAFEKLDTLRHRLIQRAGRLTRPQGQLTLTMGANEAVRKDLLHFLDVLQKAA